MITGSNPVDRTILTFRFALISLLIGRFDTVNVIKRTYRLNVTGDLVARSIPSKVIYMVIAWVLMVSYQIFTQSALGTVTSSLEGIDPSLASLIDSEANVAVFIFSFAWMFVLSSLVSIFMFGKERRLTVQFLVSLALTLTGSALLGVLRIAGLDLSNPTLLSQPFTLFFGNTFFAFLYLALPFIFMIALDLGLMKIKK